MPIEIMRYENPAPLEVHEIERLKHVPSRLLVGQLLVGQTRFVLGFDGHARDFAPMTREAAVIGGDTVRKPEEPRPQWARGIVIREAAIDGQKYIVRHVLQVALRDP